MCSLCIIAQVAENGAEAIRSRRSFGETSELHIVEHGFLNCKLVRILPRPPSWPSGRLILHRSYHSGLAEVMRVGQDGLNPTKIATGSLYSPACSPDGKFVFYISMGAPQKILRVPIQGGNSEIVGEVPGQTVRETMRVSLDGEFLAFP
jgi:hypothetical protein